MSTTKRIIDFSNVAAIDGLLDYCVANNKPVILCTTGLTDDMLKHVDEACKSVPVLRSANMSLGINTLFVSPSSATILALTLLSSSNEAI